MSLPFSTTTIVATTLLGIVITIFVLVITLLGSAVEQAKKEESAVEEEKRNKSESQRTEIKAQVRDLTRTVGDCDDGVLREKINDLSKKLSNLDKVKKDFDNKLQGIQKKYALLKVTPGIVFPGGCFLASILLNEIARVCSYANLGLALWLLSVVVVGIGVWRICLLLTFTYEIGTRSSEFQSKNLVDSFQKALALHEKEKEEELEIDFKETNFPYICEIDQEITFTFLVNLKKGKILRDASVWFFVPDEFVLISPSESWRQSAYSFIPNIRTVKVSVGDMSRGTSSAPQTLRLKSPNKEGEFSIVCILKAEGYSGKKQELKITTIDIGSIEYKQ